MINDNEGILFPLVSLLAVGIWPFAFVTVHAVFNCLPYLYQPHLLYEELYSIEIAYE